MMSQSAGTLRAFHQLLLRSVVLPVLLMGILAAFLIWQIGRLVDSARFVERTDQVIARLHQLKLLHVDMETGVRGFLTSPQNVYLEPFESARSRIDPLYDDVAAMLAERPDVVARLRAIQAVKSEWIQYATAQIERRRTGGDWLGPVANLDGKRQMDQVREEFRALVDEEELLRTERYVATERSAVITMVAAGGLTLLIGALISVISRGQLKLLSRTYEEALTQSRELSSELERRVDERTDELRTSNAQLQEANKELEAFAYSISHDLRAPMRHISGFADLLRISAGPKLTQEDSENLATIHRTAQLAGRMVDDLLSFSRIGRTRMRQAPIDMNAIVQDCRLSLMPETRERPVEWVITDLPPAVGDPALIKMVVQNLLANAVKYAGTRDKPRIEVGSRAEGEGTIYWVRDNGVGFDMAYVHKLFGVFQRLHRAEEFEGTGIGLANVRRIIVRHGGQVWAEGAPGAGAVFFFYLPNQAVSDAPHDDDQPTAAGD